MGSLVETHSQFDVFRVLCLGASSTGTHLITSLCATGKFNILYRPQKVNT